MPSKKAAQMFAIDTNVLVRIFVDDNHHRDQCQQARRFAEKHKKLFVSQIVQIELVWVLSFSYKFSKTQITTILNHLYKNDAFILQEETLFFEAVTLFEKTSADFSDCLILLQSKNKGCEIVTFDKKFSKLDGVKLLPT